MTNHELDKILWIIEDLVTHAQVLSRRSNEPENIQDLLFSLEWSVGNIQKSIRNNRKGA